MRSGHIEIRARFDSLLRGLANLGPVDKIRNAEVQTSARLMHQCLWFVARNMDVMRPDEEHQRRMLEAAQQELHNIKVLLLCAPAEKQKRGQSSGGKKTAEARKRDARTREDKLRAAAHSIISINPGLSKAALARILAERGYGGKTAIKKKLPKRR